MVLVCEGFRTDRLRQRWSFQVLLFHVSTFLTKMWSRGWRCDATSFSWSRAEDVVVHQLSCRGRCRLRECFHSNSSRC